MTTPQREAMREAFEKAHVLTDLPLYWEGNRYEDDNAQRHWFTWEAAWQAATAACVRRLREEAEHPVHTLEAPAQVVERVREMMELHGNQYDRDPECAARECDCHAAIVSLVRAACAPQCCWWRDVAYGPSHDTEHCEKPATIGFCQEHLDKLRADERAKCVERLEACAGDIYKEAMPSHERPNGVFDAGTCAWAVMKAARLLREEP